MSLLDHMETAFGQTYSFSLQRPGFVVLFHLIVACCDFAFGGSFDQRAILCLISAFLVFAHCVLVFLCFAHFEFGVSDGLLSRGVLSLRYLRQSRVSCGYLPLSGLCRGAVGR